MFESILREADAEQVNFPAKAGVEVKICTEYDCEEVATEILFSRVVCSMHYNREVKKLTR